MKIIAIVGMAGSGKSVLSNYLGTKGFPSIWFGEIIITVCPSCGSNKIKRVRRNWTGKFKRKTYMVPDLTYYECADCGERVYNRQAMQKIEDHSPAFAKSRIEKKSA